MLEERAGNRPAYLMTIRTGRVTAMFSNRVEAGRRLAQKVAQTLNSKEDFHPSEAVVIGLPRGGVPVAAEVASVLRCPLDVLVSKKIAAPLQPELAIGAVSSHGIVVLEDKLVIRLGVTPGYIEQQKSRLIKETRELERHWLQAASIQDRPPLEGRVVIVVDDGIATGMTVLAALRTLQMRGAGMLVVATPVASWDAKRLLNDECDLFVALFMPFDFQAVGFFYNDFHQVEDREVVAALRGNGYQSPERGSHVQPSLS